MLKNLKLRSKLGLSFGLILFLVSLVGGITILKMGGVKADSNKLASEYMPEIIIAGNIDSSSSMTMYNIRGYTLSSEKKFLDLGLAELQRVKESINEAEKLSEKAMHLVKLKNSLVDIKKHVAEYENLLTITINNKKELDKISSDMGSVAKEYQDSVDKILNHQNESIVKEIKESAAVEKLIERTRKIELCTELAEQGKNVRIANLKSRAENNIALMKDGLNTIFPIISNTINLLEPMLRSQDDKKELNDVKVSSEKYKYDMQTYFNKLTDLEKINSDRGAVAESVLKQSRELIDAATKHTQEITVQASSDLSAASTTIIIGISLALIAGITMAFLITRAITKPLSVAVGVAEELSQGNLTVSIKSDNADETGQLLKAMERMTINLRAMFSDIAQGVTTLTLSSNDMAAVSRQLNSSAKEAAEKSNSVATSSEEMSVNFQSVSAAMEQSSSNVNMIASSTEEMTATVNEIAESAEKARGIAEKAVQQSRSASGKMSQLGESANKIGRVTETITEISEQTNLLALNATIEAARAGESGKGFAVVANEIKELAKQTAGATVDIKNQIQEMQTTTEITVLDIHQVSEVIDDISKVINAIATAVEEQSTATREISGNIAQASQGIAEVNENVAQSTLVVSEITRDVNGINEQARQVGDGATQVQANAQNLSALAVQLDNLVKKFKI